MSNVNIFEAATRLKLRFDSVQGLLSVEDLWGLDLKTSKANKADLNSVAVVIANELESISTRSFVDDGATHPRKAPLTLALEVVKHIIAVKKAEAQAAREAADAKAELEVLTEALASKATDAIKSMDAGQLQARIQELRSKLHVG